MTISNGAFIALLFSSLMILQAIVVSIYMRLKNRDPLENFLMIPVTSFITFVFIVGVILPISQYGEAQYNYSKPKTIFTAKSNDRLILEYENGYGHYRINESDVIRPDDYKDMKPETSAGTVTATVITNNSKKKYEFNYAKTLRVNGNTQITKASITHVTKIQKCLFITIKDEYDAIQLDVTPTTKMATTE